MSGALYVVVMGLWAVVLVPTFLKRHDQRELERSFAEPLTAQLRRLSESVTSTGSIVVQRGSRSSMTPREISFQRRRRTLMVLMTWLVVFALASLTGVLPMWSLAAPLIAVSVFIFAALRYNVRHRTAAVPSQHRTSSAMQDVGRPVRKAPVIPKRSAIPLPSYLRAARATSFPPSYSPDRPWTGQAMVEEAQRRQALTAAQLRAETDARLRVLSQSFDAKRREAEQRLREAQAAAQETIDSYRLKRSVGE